MNKRMILNSLSFHCFSFSLFPILTPVVLGFLQPSDNSITLVNGLL